VASDALPFRAFDLERVGVGAFSIRESSRRLSPLRHERFANRFVAEIESMESAAARLRRQASAPRRGRGERMRTGNRLAVPSP